MAEPRRRRRKVSHLDEVRLAPVPEVVTALRELLLRACRGEVRGFAVAVAADRGCEATSYTLGESNIATLVLGLERCKGRLLDYCEDGR